MKSIKKMQKVKQYLIKNYNTVKINSNDIRVGDVFIALLGQKTHGNNYISDALEKGAKYIITDKISSNKNLSKKIFHVEDSLSFLLDIANQKRNLFKGKVIGITGSVGKTSVKENLKYFLSKNFTVSASIKSYNNYLGIILSLVNLNLNSDFAIFELGTNNFNEIKNLTYIVQPSQVIITNIYPTHLEKLINTKNIALEKSDIFNNNYNFNVELAILANNNIDEKITIDKAYNEKISKIITFGNNANSDLKTVTVKKINSTYYEVCLKYKNKNINLKVNQNQIYRLDNILISLSIFIYNNLNLNHFILLAKDIPLLEGRGKVINAFFNNKKIEIIDETYNASPQTMKTCIDYLKNFQIRNNQKKILVLGDMKELGENALNFHKDIIKYVSIKKLSNVIICGELFKLALKNSNNNITYMPDINSIINFLKKNINNDDVILIKGSNSSLTKNLLKKILEEKAN